ncbi:MAG: zinc-ribbon domain-containing protein [Candidatus Portnoybacteria bacterium]|nr:zinc-ribbon domain-containing protein [Candidatus Portnoybacteria bacterium]
MNIYCPNCKKSFRLVERLQNRKKKITCPRCGYDMPVEKKSNGKFDLFNPSISRRAAGL